MKNTRFLTALLYAICVSAIAVSSPAMSASKPASDKAVEFTRAFGDAHSLQKKMQMPELRDANPAFARIATMSEAELEQQLAEVYDVIASPDELSKVSELLKTPAGKLLAKDYEMIVKQYACDMLAYSNSLPVEQRSPVLEASRAPGWVAVRRIANDARYFGLILQRVMAAD
jgi:hypothetical protein